MNDTPDRYVADQERLRDLQRREVSVKERSQDLCERETASWPTRQRSMNHHDIVARVVMMLLEGHASDWTEQMVAEAVRCGQLAADLAYPKEEST